jgi:hypothetical protein
VWYAQEARAYGLLILASALALLCFLRCERDPSTRNLVWFALSCALALVSHYFAVFLLVPMALWLLREPTVRRRALPALAAIGVVGLALLPLISAQGGHGTQWIGRWPLGERLEAIPQYYLTGPSGAPLGHGIELLVALPLLAACAFGIWRASEPRPAGAPAAASPAAAWAGAAPAGEEDRHRRGAAISLLLAVCGFGLPLVLALAGADYLAPRNVLGAMLPTASLIAVLGTWPRARPYGPALLALGAAGLLAITLDTFVSPRLQRGNWRGLAHAIPAGGAERAYVTPLLGSAPLQHYIPGLRRLPPHRLATVREIVETFELPLSEGGGAAPAGFHLVEHRVVDGLAFFRFAAPSARTLSEEQLRRGLHGASQPSVFVPGNARSPR